MTLEERLAANRQRVLAIARQHGAFDVRVFGSVARGESGPDSDVDLLVSMEPGRSILDRAALKLDLEELLGTRVDLVDEPGLHWVIRDRVLAEAVPV